MASMRILLLALFATAMSGCAGLATQPPRAPNEGSASYHLVDDGHMAHYQLAIGDTATGGKPLQRVLPAYPPAMLSACPPEVDVQVQVIVGTTGRASEVRRYPPNAVVADAPFFDAARAAVLQWTFAPLQISHWAADANDNTHEVDSATKPFSLVYAFRFACRAGRATVTSSPARE